VGAGIVSGDASERAKDGERESTADSIQELTAAVVAFRDARDWKQFHTPKDTAVSLALEAAEVL